MPSVGIVILDTSAGHYLDPHCSKVSCDVMELSGNEATVDFLSQFIYNQFQISLQAHSNTNSVVCGDLNTGLQCWPVLGFPLLKCKAMMFWNRPEMRLQQTLQANSVGQGALIQMCIV